MTGGSKKRVSTEAPLFTAICELVVSARKTVARGVDTVQVLTNFEIGHRIVEYEQQGEKRAGYGQEVLRALSERLTAEFGGGFSKRNLEYMRRFYLEHRDRRPGIAQTVSAQSSDEGKSQTLSDQLPISESLKAKGDRRSQKALAGLKTVPDEQQRQEAAPFRLGWSHYVFLMGIRKREERRFYEIEAVEQGWSLRELKRQFDSGLYERLALSRDKAGIRRLARKGQVVAKPEDILKEPYVLEFLGLEEKARYSESDLETAIIDKLETFLLELGKGFLFEARQKRFTFGEDHFFVDLVFFNRLLRCYVLIDLKIGTVTHQDLGQMQMYVNYFDRYVKTSNEERTIGIILCKKKHVAMVEITLPPEANIHAREYQLYLPSKDELRKKLLEWAEESVTSEYGHQRRHTIV